MFIQTRNGFRFCAWSSVLVVIATKHFLKAEDVSSYISPNCDLRCRMICEDGFQCSPYGSCEQRQNGATCSCNPGYEGDGVDCTPISAIDLQDMSDSDSGQTTKSGQDFFSTNCDTRCRMICEDDYRCSPHGTCERRQNRGSCSCNIGYEGDGVNCTPIPATDCQDVYDSGRPNTQDSGIYDLNPGWSQDPVRVYCNMSQGGGWTVIQRQDGSENFYRTWTEYKNGFGSLDGGMWLGNDKIYHLTNQKRYELRIDVADREGGWHYAHYTWFRINDESDKYRLTSLGHYSGNADYNSALHKNLNKQFSTYDQDNDGWRRFNCAEEHRGAWWFYYAHYCDHRVDRCRNYCNTGEYYCFRFPAAGDCAHCSYIHLNGNYSSTARGKSISWAVLIDGYDCGIQYTEMRIRPTAE